MKKYCVYCHTTPSNRKYVGISCDPRKRWNEGKGYSKNYVFYRAIRKYGWENIRHDILFDGLSLEEAKEVETRLISEWHLTDRRYGYNLRDGGDGSFSQESRAKMSASRMGNTNTKGKKLRPETKAKISNSLKRYYVSRPGTFAGQHHSESTKLKLSQRIVSQEQRVKMSHHHADVTGARNPSAKPIVQLSEDGDVLKRYAYASLAAEELSIDLSSLIKCCRGKQKTCGGFRWAYDKPAGR